VFSAEADIPPVWECPRCGAESLRSDGERPELKEEKAPRTHWDMLRERRSIAELEELLAERLSQLRSGELGSTALSSRGARPRRAPELSCERRHFREQLYKAQRPPSRPRCCTPEQRRRLEKAAFLSFICRSSVSWAASVSRPDALLTQTAPRSLPR
jgi:hypothetical protein